MSKYDGHELAHKLTYRGKHARLRKLVDELLSTAQDQKEASAEVAKWQEAVKRAVTRQIEISVMILAIQGEQLGPVVTSIGTIPCTLREERSDANEGPLDTSPTCGVVTPDADDCLSYFDPGSSFVDGDDEQL